MLETRLKIVPRRSITCDLAPFPRELCGPRNFDDHVASALRSVIDAPLQTPSPTDGRRSRSCKARRSPRSVPRGHFLPARFADIDVHPTVPRRRAEEGREVRSLVGPMIGRITCRLKIHWLSTTMPDVSVAHVARHARLHPTVLVAAPEALGHPGDDEQSFTVKDRRQRTSRVRSHSPFAVSP